MKSLEGKKRGGTAGPTSTLGGSYKPSVTSSLSKSKQSVNNDSHSLQGHGHSNANSLRRKELHQLETFIKTRSQQLDSEIDQIRDKLKKSGKLGHSQLIPDPNASAALNADIISQRTGKPGMTVSGTGLGRVSLQSQSILQQSKTATASLSQDVNTSRKLATISEKERGKDDNNTMAQLATLLATLKLKCEDAGLTDIELRELLLPSDLMEPGDFKLPLSEISSVLQTDLLMPLSNYDQRLLLEMYGDEKNLVDVRMLLSDAGLWYEIPGRDDRNPLVLSSTADRMAEKLQLSPPKKDKRVSAVDDEDLSKSGIFKQQTKQILKDTNTHVDSLHDLHELIMEEREWDDLTNSATANFQNVRGKGTFDPSKDLDISLTAVKKRTPMEGSYDQTPRSTGRQNSPRTNAVDPTTPATPTNKKQDDGTGSDPQKYATSREKLKDLLASSGMSKDTDLVQALAEENQRLKKEIAAFDGDFFEELEDLKYRYAKLQEVIGEDPLAPSLFGKNQLPTPLNDATVHDADGTSKLPLSRLAWSVRNSMRAMDRAADDSPLVQGPRMVNAYTYAPGVPSTIGDRNLTSANHHRSLSAIRSETVATAAAAAAASSSPPAVAGGLSHSSSSSSSQRHPYAMPSSTSGRVLDGGIHGIGGGKYTAAPDEAGGNFSNLCERRLVFELANQPNPYNATNEFLARVVDVAEKNLAMAKDPAKVGGLFISVKQLMEIMMHSRLSLSAKEVEVLASGFASDGQGSIDAQEFCDMVRMLLYNLTGSHFLQQSTSRSTANGRTRRRPPAGGRAGDEDDGHGDGDDHDDDRGGGPGERVIHPLLRNAEYRRLVVDLCETMITYDRQALLGTSKNLMQTLLKPFVEEDVQGSGVLSFAEFVSVVKSMGSMFSYHEYKVLAAPFVLEEPPAASAYPSSNLNHLKSFREAKLTGALRGKASTQGVIGDFLAEHHLGDIVQRPITMADVDARVVDDSIIEYPPFVKMVVDELDALLEAQGGLDLTSASRLPWVLKEMEFVDVLITQLENMRATARRKVLITLQYALQNADTKQVGELDGFALLTTLLNCGFRLQRYHRVQLLQAAEEFGGTLEYSRLILTLLQTAIDWTHHERDIVLKILKAMGVTVTERRQWLAKLKKMLLQSASQTKLKLTARRSARSAAATATATSAKGRVRGVEHRVQLNKEAETEEDLLVWSQRLTSDGDEPPSSSSSSAGAGATAAAAVVMIAPSAFLHVLRDCHVHLSPEEEATLLDCLDTERIARQEASSFAPIHHHSQQKNTARLLFGSGGGGGGDGFNVPMVDFQSFLSFCSRHCGSWVDNKPRLQSALHDAIATLHNPLQALHEFITLLTSFDERKQGFISQRAFLICCHRARLLANVPETVLTELTEVLAVDGAGEIEYRSLILQLRGICSGLTMQQLETAHTSLLHQLLRNASDHRETLAPLRNWLLHHTDIQAMMLTTREFNALLREFSVLYRPDDLDLLLMEIGQEVDFQDVASVMATSKAHVGRATGERRYDSQHRVEHVQRTTWVVDTKKFMALCLRTRPSWLVRNPRLAKHLLLSLKRLYHQRHAASAGGSAAMPAVNLTLTIDGSEMAALDDVMNRIRAFASDEFRSASALPPTYDSHQNGGLAAFQTAGAHTKDEQRPVTLIEADIFAYIVRHLGIELTKEDIQFLCDASDPYPEARHINPDLLYDILHIEWLQQQQQQSSNSDGADAPSSSSSMMRTPNEVTDEDLAMLTDAAVYALDHLQQLVRKTQAHCGRTVEEWTADLRCLFTGFDPHGQGFMTYEDFLLALSLLNVKMSAELIKDIPYVGKNRGYVQYPKIVDYILRANPVGYGKKPGQTTRDGLVASGSKTELLQHLSEHDAEEEAKGKRSMTIRQRQDALERTAAGGTGPSNGGGPGPVLGLLRVVRKKMCGFIVSEANVEEAWLEMLRVFQRFDVTEQKVVSPRDFCLAVSVLLDDDQMVLTKDEWEEIIAYFAVPPAETSGGSRSFTKSSSAASAAPKSRVTVNGDVAVDYMLFCEMVLDPSEVQKKLQDVKFSRLASASTAKMDRAKEKLSTSTANKSRTNSVDRQRMQAALSDPSPSSSFRKQAWAAGGSDTIEDRFERASVKYQETMKQGKEYGSGSGSATASSRALGRVDAGTDSYRVARTQGQASRDSAAVRLRAPKSATVTVPSKDIYLAGKGVGSSRPSSAPRGRLNQTSY